MGVPTDIPRPDEKYIPQYRMYVAVSAAARTVSNGCASNRTAFTANRPACAARRFEVDDLDAALLGRAVLLPPGCPSEGVRSAMILHNGAPVELLTFGRESEQVIRE